jgi:tetratricopeptide (TPR) repeat protein
VQGIIAARLDSLASEEKALLQDAAVLGKVFWLGALGATEQQLHVLRQKEFVQRARRSSVEGEVEYAFKHVLVRDVAYGQIPRAQRAEKHLRAADWIESLGRPDDHAEMVAHHYMNGLELARAAGDDVEALTERTARALREAGERALTLNALAQAESYYRQAVALAPDNPELLLRYGRVLYLQDEQGESELTRAREQLLALDKRESAAEATLLLADIAWKQGRGEDVESVLQDARSLVTDLPASRAQAAVLTEVARYEALAGRVESALELGLQALAMAEELRLDDLRLRALNTVAIAHGDMGDTAGLAELEEVIDLATRLNAVTEIVRGWNNLTALRSCTEAWRRYARGKRRPCAWRGTTACTVTCVSSKEARRSGIAFSRVTGRVRSSGPTSSSPTSSREPGSTGPVPCTPTVGSSALPAATTKAPSRTRRRRSSMRAPSAIRKPSIRV